MSYSLYSKNEKWYGREPLHASFLIQSRDNMLEDLIIVVK